MDICSHFLWLYLVEWNWWIILLLSLYLILALRLPDCFSNFPGGSHGKASVYSAGDLGLSPGLGRSPGEGNGISTPVLLPGKSHRQRSLVGYSLWGRKESDMTERLHFHFQFIKFIFNLSFKKLPDFFPQNDCWPFIHMRVSISLYPHYIWGSQF